MSGSASYSGGSSTNVSERTTTNDYTSTPVVGAGGTNISAVGSGNTIAITQQGLQPSEIQSLAGFASVLASSGQNSSSGAGATVPVVTSGGGSGSLLSSGTIELLVLAGAAALIIYMVMRR
jgi:hypothetical protein